MLEPMQVAIAEAYAGINAADGGPFGAVVVQDGTIVGRGHNRVLCNHDPTCHAEMEAIRDAAKNLGTHDLSGCELYVTAEPCPMCLSAAVWAGITTIYFGCDKDETAKIGFKDADIYAHFAGKTCLVSTAQVEHKACQELFLAYAGLDAERY